MDSSTFTTPTPSITQTLKHVFSHTGRNWGSTLVGSFTYLLVQYGSVILAGLSLGVGISGINQAISGETDTINVGAFSIPFIVAAAIMGIISWIMQVASCRGFVSTDTEEPVHVSEFFVVNSSVFKAMGTQIIVGIITALPVIIASILTMATSSSAINGNDSNMSAAGAVILTLGVVFSLIAVFYMRFSIYYTLAQNVNPFVAMKRSCEDVARNPLFALGMGVIMFIILAVASIFLIPLLFFIPLYQVGSARTYRALTQHRIDEVVAAVEKDYAESYPSSDQSTEDFQDIFNHNNDQVQNQF